MVISPVNMSTVAWTQPEGPFESRLQLCRVRSKPGLTVASMNDTPTYSGPAITPQPSSDFVTRSARHPPGSDGGGGGRG